MKTCVDKSTKLNGLFDHKEKKQQKRPILQRATAQLQDFTLKSLNIIERNGYQAGTFGTDKFATKPPAFDFMIFICNHSAKNLYYSLYFTYRKLSYSLHDTFFHSYFFHKLTFFLHTNTSFDSHHISVVILGDSLSLFLSFSRIVCAVLPYPASSSFSVNSLRKTFTNSTNKIPSSRAATPQHNSQQLARQICQKMCPSIYFFVVLFLFFFLIVYKIYLFFV